MRFRLPDVRGHDRIRTAFQHPVWQALHQALSCPAVAYLMLFLLQLKVIWGIWEYRDITYGDTSSYFRLAVQWYQARLVNLAWSPVYTAFYGSLLYWTTNPITVTWLHRVIIVFTASLLVLAVMRRLLPSPLAWLVAAWWAVLPINFNTLYEVHLFTVLPALVALLLIQSRSSPWTRAGGLGIFLLCMVLVRNEFLVGVFLWALCCLVAEAVSLRRREAGRRRALLQILSAYGAMLVGVTVVVLGAYRHSEVKQVRLQRELEWKHTLNMAQVFTFGYQQRHPEWKHSPWDEFQDVMLSHFGKLTPSLREMVQTNPRAVAAHVLWNYRLTPAGLQLLLFNATSGTLNPDYVPVQTKSVRALVLSIGLLSLWGVGLVLILAERRYWWEHWLRPRLACWLALLSLTAVVALVIATQRPRPSYLFLLSILLMAVTGLAALAVVRRCRLDGSLNRLLPLGMVAAVVFVPPYYHLNAGPNPPTLPMDHTTCRPLARSVERMMPFQSLLSDPRTVILQGDNAQELAAYVGFSRCRAYDYRLLSQWPCDLPLEQFLRGQGINLCYLDEALLGDLEAQHPQAARAFLGTTPAAGWRLVACQDVPGDRWRLYQLCP